MKKFLSVLMAVMMFLSVFVITSSAAKAPTITATANKSTAKVGDTVKVTVSTSTNSKMCSALLTLEYNTSYFQVVNKTTSSAFPYADLNSTTGKVVFVGASGSVISDSATTLFTVEFKVLKTGGKIKFVANEVYVVDGGKDVNVTRQVAGTTITIACSHQNKQETITKQPTCTEKGTKKTVCKDCGKDFGKTDISAKGHKVGNWEVKTAPTCTKEGESVRKCTVCKAVVETRKDAKKAHTPGDWEISVEATDTKPGTKVKKCKVCNTVLETETYQKYKMGDVDGNGKVTTIDARRVLQYASGSITLTPEQVKRADMNGDGKVTTIDARKVLQLAASIG